MLRQHIYAAALGYAHQDDADTLAHDVAMKLAVWDRTSKQVADERLASQPSDWQGKRLVNQSKRLVNQSKRPVNGELSDLDRKSVEPMADAAGVPPRSLQEFLSLFRDDIDPFVGLLSGG